MSLIAQEYDEYSGMWTQWFGSSSGKVTIRRVQNVEPCLITNVAEYNSHSSKARVSSVGMSGVGRKVASIPMATIERVLKETGINLLNCTQKEKRKILNDINFQKFRTAPGRL